ncbi:hypothetical protein IC582_030159 [Cucumis melo]
MNNSPHWHSGELMCVGVTIEFWREVEILSKLHHPNCSFEGGIAGESGSEAHGECGFQRRTNKLVDGCYSFWQGGVSSLLKRLSLDIDEQLVQPYAREGSSFDDLSTGLPSIFFFCFQPILRACYLHQYLLV